MRETQQRLAIREVFLSAGRPLSINEIFEMTKKKIKSMGIATIYRNLKSLQSEGWIIQVDLPGQSSRWELAPQAHHHHFLCRKCDKLYEIQVCSENLSHLMLPDGYILEGHDILLRGQCAVCTGGKISPINQKVEGKNNSREITIIHGNCRS
jgi:Fur family transcriptional regulator, ferric uptake regulator